jgi:mono/diheme cytochrome c family protein
VRTISALIIGSIALPALIVAAGLLGRLPSDATGAPMSWESKIALRALDASLERRAKGLTNPIASTDSAARAAGAKIYARNCAGCHGDATGPSQWGSKGLYPRVPQFFQDGTDVSPEEAFAAIDDGIRYSGMGAWRDVMNEADIWKVANFVSAIRPAPAIKHVKNVRGARKP